MKKIYRLKPWDEVENHHLIDKEAWNELANAEALDVEECFLDTVLIVPRGVPKTFRNIRAVTKDDLYVVEEKNPCDNNCNCNTNLKKKTYTKDDIRNAGMRVMETIGDDEDSAVASALAIAKLIKELN